MADGRMLKKKISFDVRWADLADDTQRLLFTVGIAHLDIEGRISGDPREFKALVAPMLGHITTEAVQGFFDDAGKLGLIQRYQAGNRWYIHYPGFKKNQKLRGDKEAPSRYPAPPGEFSSPEYDSGTTRGEIQENSGTTPVELQEDSGSTPTLRQVKLREENLREVKLTKDLSPEATTVTAIHTNTELVAVPYIADIQAIAALWNEIAPAELSRVNLPFKRQPKTMRKINEAIKRNPTLEWWKELIGRVHSSPFLRGKVKPWKASFDFVLTNAEEIMDGKYDGPGPIRPKGFDALAAWINKNEEGECDD